MVNLLSLQEVISPVKHTLNAENIRDPSCVAPLTSPHWSGVSFNSLV